MTDGYTPTERQMETAWCEYAHAVDASAGRLREDDEDPSGEYARFIAKVKADAVREVQANVRASSFWADGSDNYADRVRGYLSSRADRIERGER